MTAALLTAALLGAFITLTAAICSEPRTCASCGHPVPRRHIVTHLTECQENYR